jgi:DNA-binding response OmpR family regulator
LKKRSLGTKVVIMTVRCQAEVVEQMAAGDIDGWLFKPFRIRELSAMLDFVGLATPARFPAKGSVIAGLR